MGAARGKRDFINSSVYQGSPYSGEMGSASGLHLRANPRHHAPIQNKGLNPLGSTPCKNWLLGSDSNQRPSG